jgi:uncharacterized membrane protein
MDRLPDGTIPSKAACVSVAALVPGHTGTVKVSVPPQVSRAGLTVGNKIRLAYYPAQGGDPASYAWYDYDRRLPLTLLAVAFVLAVIAVARLKGLAAVLGLIIAFPTITGFMLPALQTGATVIMTAVLYLTHGISTKTTVALLGTLSGLLVSAGLAWWVSGAAHLDGLSSEQNVQLSQLTTGAGLNGLVLSGVIIASLGVLNDVTIAQAASIWELRAMAPQLRVHGLFGSGMRIGRDHLASTVYTIAFASAGAALPTLVLINLYQQPLTEVLNGGQMAEEIVRTLVAAIGLVLTIPLTTAIAAVVATSLRRITSPIADDASHDVRHQARRDGRHGAEHNVIDASLLDRNSTTAR